MLGILTNWKTTVAGVVAFVALLLGQLDIVQLTAQQEDTIVAFAILVIGFIAGDAKSLKKKDGDK